MSNYETYRDVLSDHGTRRHVFGSSVVIVLLALAAVVAASMFF